MKMITLAVALNNNKIAVRVDSIDHIWTNEEGHCFVEFSSLARHKRRGKIQTSEPIENLVYRINELQNKDTI